MAFGNSGNLRSSGPVGEINMVPLIDVMLVLVVIFLVTAPLLTHAVKIDLPEASSAPNATPEPQKIDLSVDAAGQLYWNENKVVEAELPALYQQAAARVPKPELHIRADKGTRFEVVTRVMSAAAKAGLNKIGFVSDPG